VLGFAPGVDTNALKDRIGVCLQSTNLPDKITVAESLALFGSFYSRTADADQLLGRLQLAEKKNAYYDTLSGGEAQRVKLASFLGKGKTQGSIHFIFDEPTTSARVQGLNPNRRSAIKLETFSSFSVTINQQHVTLTNLNGGNDITLWPTASLMYGSIQPEIRIGGTLTFDKLEPRANYLASQALEVMVNFE